MSDFNSQHNRVVWVDVPVADLERANTFYAAVLSVGVHAQEFGGVKFSVIDHHDGNGGCLVLKPEEVASKAGLLVYFNVNGRIRDAVAKVQSGGGKVIEPVHPIGPHGFRAIILDTEGNRIALHSTTDA
jgi:predicted enzyme related to lactoylglutathione lyase